MKLRQISFALCATAIGLASYSIYTSNKDAEKYKSVNDLKIEIAQKDPKRYDSLMHDGISRHSFRDWQYEVNKMNDSIKTDSMIKKAYFEGAQMIRDSINKERKR